MTRTTSAADRQSPSVRYRRYLFTNNQDAFATLGVAVLMTLIAMPAIAMCCLADQGGAGLVGVLLVVLALLWYSVMVTTRSIQWDGHILICRRLAGTYRYDRESIVAASVGREWSWFFTMCTGFFWHDTVLRVRTADRRAFVMAVNGEMAKREASEFVDEFGTPGY